MLGTETKKRKKVKTKIPSDDQGTEIAEEQQTSVLEEIKAEKEIAAATSQAVSEIPDGEEKNEEEKTENSGDYSAFARFADILDTDEKTILEECRLFQAKKILSKVSRAVVRYGLTNMQVKAMVHNASVTELGGIAVSPAYLKDVAVHLKDKAYIKVCSVIDFPFGESSFKVKTSEMKNSVKKGVDGILVVFNASEISKEKTAVIKKQLKKIGKIKGVQKGVAVSAEDIEKEDLKRFLHLTEKFVDYAAFLFGNVSIDQLNAKMKEINGYKGKIAVKVMANVENIFGVKTLIKSGVDEIITPYADEIAKELFKEFDINSVKLV
ncbi:MAG: hypothetical protein J5911_05370 [Clostridia bacterium]|nr:hypothetical protein [Clostridia bacterium]